MSASKKCITVAESVVDDDDDDDEVNWSIELEVQTDSEISSLGFSSPTGFQNGAKNFVFLPHPCAAWRQILSQAQT
jgi:hypothetical protein